MKGKIYLFECRDKKAFLSDQCKEIEETNRIGKTSDLFKNIRDTKGTFHTKKDKTNKKKLKKFFLKKGQNKGQKWYGPSRSSRY